MYPVIEPIHRKESLQEDGMLFVRTSGIHETMVKVPLLVASVIIVASMMPIQSSFSSPRVLDLIIYPDGTTHVSAEVDLDPLSTDYELELFGSAIDNFVAVGENQFLLSSTIIGASALIETFGSSTITVEYDIHDLVSKQGRVWTFSLDTPSDFTLLLPKNSAIVGMTNLPINMEITNEQNLLTLPGGNTEIDYLFSTTDANNPPTLPTASEPDSTDLLVLISIALLAAVGAGTILFIKKTKQTKSLPALETASSPKTTVTSLDPETIFSLRPDIREYDKEIVKFIFDSGGEVFESNLRKKFLQPRTTMWRAVKRLERNGIIEIEKKDLQNLVKLRKDMEKEE
jgi:uncharacterized membrane protein